MPDRQPSEADLRALYTVLVLANDTRGGDAWGFVTPGHKPVKGLGIMQNARVVRYLPQMRTVMGHTRRSTMGGNVVENAHPYEINGIVGAHNGMIHNWHIIKGKYDEYKDFKVDSQCLIGHIAYGRPLNELEGYGTIEYIDTKAAPNSVFLGRMTDSAQLSIAKVKHVGIVWSSDKDHLERALKIAGFNYQLFNVSVGTLFEANAGVLYKHDDTRSIAITHKEPNKQQRNATGYNGNPYPSQNGIVYGSPQEWHFCQAPKCTSKLYTSTARYCYAHEPKQYLALPNGGLCKLESGMYYTWQEMDQFVEKLLSKSTTPVQRLLQRSTDALESLEGDAVAPPLDSTAWCEE